MSKFILPAVDQNKAKNSTKLPFNGSVVQEKGFSFSFACFDRTHVLFNLGDKSQNNGVVSGSWFLDLLDCLKSINGMTVHEACRSLHDLHRVDWKKANTSVPAGSEQAEYWQFRINKSKGRVIGILLEGVFYVVWLDPHHNLTDSPHYGTATYHPRPPSDYEVQEQVITDLTKSVMYWKGQYEAAQALLDEIGK